MRAPRQSSTLQVTLLIDVEEFVAAHRPHGTLTGNATEPACNGYLLTVACPVWGGVRAVGDARSSRR